MMFEDLNLMRLRIFKATLPNEFFKDVEVEKSDKDYMLEWLYELSKFNVSVNCVKELFDKHKDITFPVKIEIESKNEFLFLNLLIIKIKDSLGKNFLFELCSSLNHKENTICIFNFDDRFVNKYYYSLNEKGIRLKSISLGLNSDTNMYLCFDYEDVVKVTLKSNDYLNWNFCIKYEEIEYEIHNKIVCYLIEFLKILYKNENYETDVLKVFLDVYDIFINNGISIINNLSIDYIIDEEVVSQIICKNSCVKKYIYSIKKDESFYLKGIITNKEIKDFIVESRKIN